MVHTRLAGRFLTVVLTIFSASAFSQFQPAWLNRVPFATLHSTVFAHGGVSTHTTPAGETYVLQRTSASSGQIYKVSVTGALLWQTNNPALGIPQAMSVDADGNAYVTASADSTAVENFLAKINSSGELLWVIPARLADVIRVGPNGHIFTASATSWGYVVSHFSPEGVLVWESTENPGLFLGLPTDLEVDDAGSVYLTSMEFITAKFDSSGQLMWWARDPALESSGPSLLIPQGYDVVLDAVGNVYATGSTGSATNYNDIVTVKYDSQGQTVWTARYDGPEHGFDDGVALTVDAEGNTYVAGMGNAYNIIVIKYSPLGTQQWVARYQNIPDSVDWPKSIRLDASGNILVFGSSSGLDLQHHLVMVRVDSHGNRNAVVRFGDFGGAVEMPVGFGLDTNGAVYLVGNSFGLDGYGTMVNPTNIFSIVLRYDPIPNAGSPRITLPPRHQTLREGSRTVFAVKAQGLPPLRYQWRLNGVPIPGGTNATLRIKTVSSYSTGGYSVEVVNRFGSESSPEAYLQMTPLPPPRVSIRSLDRRAREYEPGAASVNTATFLIRLSRRAYSGLNVDLCVQGTAENDLDYFLTASDLGTSDCLRRVYLAPGARSAKVRVYPYGDDVEEAAESVTLQLQPSDSYEIGHRESATAVILPPRH